MKRVGVVFIFLLVLVPLAMKSANANSSHWYGVTTIQEAGEITEQTVHYPNYCDFTSISRAKLNHQVHGELSEHLPSIYSEPYGERCVVTNSQGSFELNYLTSGGVQRHVAGSYSPNQDLSRLMKWNMGFGSFSWLEPAPQGQNVLELFRPSSFDSNYELTVHKNIRSWGVMEGSGKDVVWARDHNNYENKIAQKLQHADGGKFAATLHRFSPNGRYLLVRSTEGLVLVDLVNYSRTFVVQVSVESGQKPVDFSVSNDGKNVVYTDTDNNLTMINASSCELTEKWGSWQKRFVHKTWPRKLYSGCEEIKNFKTAIDQAGLFTINAQIRRLYFNSVGSELYFSLKSESWTTENPANEYSWKEYKVVAEEYVPSAAGYLAMGDSFSSGEGDTQGSTWYESGTDDHGDKDTFSGRNLCHLSRRSYPYLIALELGFLADNQSSPPADGLFHSVACSGAKIHNIIGGAYGEKHDTGGENDFARTDNQYIHDDRYSLENWQPGFTKQLNSLNETILVSESTRGFEPEVITLGIGGNDAGFGNFLETCVYPGTCDHAINNTNKATNLGVRIAQLKTRLSDTYKQIKAEAPEARIYVHGYPVFIRSTGGSCALNVRLNDQERQFAANATEYMNRVIEAAAEEAGVVYIDVTNIFEGGKLCDEGNKYMNGATAGNDKLNILGNESFHPNNDGFIAYKNAILSATNNLTKPMPTPVTKDYPLPNINLFGERSFYMIHAMNQSYGVKQQITSQESFITDEQGGKITVNQDGMYPNSTATIEMHSTPIKLGNFTVNGSGELITNIKLPVLAPGHHELHIFGYNSHGELIDYYQPLFIPFSADDIDGDGVPDAQDTCTTLPNIGTDADEDGIDDGCDNNVAVFKSSSSSNSTNVPERSDSANNHTNNQSSSVSAIALPESPASIPNNEINQQRGNSQNTGSAANQNEVLGDNSALNNASLAEPYPHTGVQWQVITLILTGISIMIGIFTKFAYAKNN